MDELAMFDYTKRKHGRDDGVDATTQALNHMDDIIRRRKNRSKHKKKLNIMCNYNSPIYPKTTRARKDYVQALTLAGEIGRDN
jgi:hypothetical protein